MQLPEQKTMRQAKDGEVFYFKENEEFVVGKRKVNSFVPIGKFHISQEMAAKKFTTLCDIGIIPVQ